MYSSNWYQAKTQYIDNFVLTARSNEPEPVVVDKTALQKAIDANTGKVETDYTAETWADFAKTLADAKAVLADENATQNDIDAAAKNRSLRLRLRRRSSRMIFLTTTFPIP